MFWTLYVIDCLLLFQLVISSCYFALFFSFGISFSVSPFWLTPFVFFSYVLGRFAMSPGLSMVTLCNGCFVRPSVDIFLVTWARCSKGIPCVDFMCLRLLSSLDCYCQVCIWDWSSCWLAVRTGFDYSGWVIVWGLTPWRGSCFIGAVVLWCLPSLPLGCVIIVGNGWCSGIV